MRRPVFSVLAAAVLVAACNAEAPTDPSAGAPPSEAASVETAPADASPAAADADAANADATPSGAATDHAGLPEGHPCGDDPGDYADSTFIAVTSPERGSTVSSPFTVDGCANTPDGTYGWELVTADGEAVATGTGVLECGGGCVSPISFDVTFDATTGPATLRTIVFNPSDGSHDLVIEVGVVVG